MYLRRARNGEHELQKETGYRSRLESEGRPRDNPRTPAVLHQGNTRTLTPSSTKHFTVQGSRVHTRFFTFPRNSTTRNKNKNFKKKREQNRRIRLSGTRSDQSINLIMRREAYNRQPASDRNEEEALNCGQGINGKIGELQRHKNAQAR